VNHAVSSPNGGLLMKFLLTLTSSVLAAAAMIGIMPVRGESGIYSDVLRLHVIAESDSDEDQALKLKVRDAVLECVQETVGSCSSFGEAYAAVDGMKAEIEEAAEECVRSNGRDCTVRVELGREEYPRRDYGSAVLPAGVYPSLRVVLGEGSGKNWWCVLFPTVCVRFADAGQEEYIAAGFTPEEYRIITGEQGSVKVRFRILEILSEVITSFCGGKIR